MYYSREQLAELCGVGVHCIRTYLCRAEFANCTTDKSYLFNMSDEQIDRLKYLVRSRNGERGFYAKK